MDDSGKEKEDRKASIYRLRDVKLLRLLKASQKSSERFPVSSSEWLKDFPMLQEINVVPSHQWPRHEHE